jgi:NADPH2:quinone reductase
MKAAVYYENGGPDVFKYEDVPDPELRPGGVLIDVQAVGIEGGDVLNRAGGALTAKPHIVGYNCAGVVREVGDGVTDRKPGDRVTALMPNGSHASMVSVASAQTWLVPDAVPIEQAACVPVAWGTAADCIHEFGRLEKGETALIQAGASGVGLACVQLAHRAGARVIATVGSDDKIERLKQYGLDDGVNYREKDFVAEVRRLTAGKGVNLVVDPVGDTLEGSIRCLAYRGRAISVGNVSRSDKKLDISPLSEQNRSLTGVFFGAETMVQPARVRKLLDDLLADIAKGELRVVIDRTYPLSEAGAAHAYIESRAAFGRVVLVV